jgi:hypothetical protein
MKLENDPNQEVPWYHVSPWVWKLLLLVIMFLAIVVLILVLSRPVQPIRSTRNLPRSEFTSDPTSSFSSSAPICISAAPLLRGSAACLPWSAGSAAARSEAADLHQSQQT